MSRSAWTPWHQVVRLREDLRTGQLSLAQFAADLYDVRMNRGPEIYRDLAQFFALTYPTFNIRELAKDVVLRLAGKSEKAIRQLELTYGGGKTHSLITLYHLVREPSTLPNLPAVREFIQHIGAKPPKARVVVMPFDKLDVEKGMEVLSPSDKGRWLRHPWSVLAYQIAGDEGLRLLHADGKYEERDSPPAENLLTDLLKLPAKDGLATLILIDEVLMYAREKIGLDPRWRDRLLDSFQYLTQAAVKVERCAIVASLLATDPRKSDDLGKELTHDLYERFRREREESVEPVTKEDVAEVLRRRFFTPESLKDREAFRAHIVAAVKNIAALDEQTNKDGKAAEDRYLASYPFHPDLTDVLYTKWTQLEGFQRTRGVLRTFALALRDAERWDTSPLIGPNVFLGESRRTISESARELTIVAATEEHEGRKQDWNAILLGELEKARAIQDEIPGLKCREAEQAVFTTFLHSQPIGQKAATRELIVLLGQTRPDKIELEKALQQWANDSWFLDEALIQEAEAGTAGAKQLPKNWRLGSKPNLRQIHHVACTRVSGEFIEARLLDEIAKVKKLDEGARAAGTRVHMLPERPSDIEDDGEFHYAVLGPKAASDPGKPNAEVVKFLNETTGPDRPRVHRNALVLTVPSRDGLEAARNRIREYLGWEEVRSLLKDHDLDPVRAGMLATYLEGSKKKVPDAIRQAYCIVATVSEKNEVQALKVGVAAEPLFATIKADKRVRIQETPISAEALLPDGPYNLWRAGETSRWVKNLVGAFASDVRLPKMLNRKAILDTLIDGCKEGLFVLRLVRPDRSVRSWWREAPDDVALGESALELVLPVAAELTALQPSLLLPGVVQALWPNGHVTVDQLLKFFKDGRAVKVPKDGYEDVVAIPKAERRVVEQAVREAVREGKLWLTSGPASILAEEIPAGILTDDAVLQLPPPPILPMQLIPDVIPEAWENGRTTALALATVLSRREGKTLPWATIREALDGAFRGRYLERAVDSGPWPCDYAGAQQVRITLPREKPIAEPPAKPYGVLATETDLTASQIQDLAEEIGAIIRAAAGYSLKFRLRMELGDASKQPSDSVVAEINQRLAKIVPNLKIE